MAPPPLPMRHCAPRHVTEDTPPDLLEGTMDLEVTLPNGKTVVMNVHRSTPMMDLLVQVTTAHRINPGGHVIQVISDNIFLTYKPSTPIGTLDTTAIKIVAKNKINELANMRKSTLQQQAIERNIRLKPKEWVYKQQLVVNLPHSQLAVYRVPPKALISDVFSMVCEDKNLDPETHEIRHPVNVDERLRGSCSLNDYQLQEVCVVSSDFRPPPLSVTDLITMSSIAHPEDKKRRGFLGLFSRKAKSSTGDSSVSSGSAEERSVSPARSDESAEGRPTPLANSPASSSGTLTNLNHTAALATTSHHNSMASINSSARMSRPVSMISLNKTKKRPAPVPPRRERRSDLSASKGQVNGKVKESSSNRSSLSRHSSDSSGYHEPDIRSSHASPSGSEVSSIEASRSAIAPPVTNLTTVASNSSLSVSSCSKGKRKAPSPPKPCSRNGIGSTAIPESPEEVEGSPRSKHSSKDDSVLAQELELSKSLSVEDSSESNSSSLKRTSTPEVCEVVHKDEDEKENKDLSTSSSPVSDSKGHTDEVASRLSPSHSEEGKNLMTDHLNADTNGEAVVELSVEPARVDTPKPPPRERSVSPAPPMTSEHEVQTRTVSLSSDTSSTSVEMLNPRDIQRPRRQKRKKIPEEFLRTSSLKDSSSSSEQRKNFERVEEAEESEIGHSKAEPPAGITENSKHDMEGSSLRNKVAAEDSEASPHSSLTEEENRNMFSDDALDIHEDETDRNTTTEAYNEIVREVSNPSVMYVELLDQEESSTDPPSIGEKPQIYTSKVQLSLVQNQKNTTQNLSGDEFKVPAPVARPLSLTSTSKSIPKIEISPEDVIAELKSAIVSPDEVQPRILNFKPKGKDWNVEKPPDYNVVLSFGTTATDPSAPRRSHTSSLERKVPTRTSSTSSYESAEGGAPRADGVQIRNSRSSTETSYESAPPPIPESRVPISSDTDSKASSVAVSRQSSFSDSDGREFVKPSAPAFSISTYQSRASKVSYDKKLSRSESLNSFKDLHQNDDEKKLQTEGKVMSLTRSDSRRNQAFRSDELKKKSTSTTFLNLNLADGSDSIVRPSMLKSQSKNLFANASSSSSKRSPDGSIQFELSSSKEPVTFNRPIPNTFSNLRKAKSTYDIRGPEGRVPEGFEAVPDSGLANEYMRLQDDFVKWQQQLLQNQRVLHNRVAPIASNPPTLNSVGMVNNMMNQQSQNQQPQQPRKPVEITIPIRFEDSDEDEKSPPVKPASQSTTQAPQSNTQWRSAPSVPVAAWQERPINVVRTQQQPEVVGHPQPVEMQRQFGKQPALQTVYHSAPQGRQQPVSQNSFQQVSQPSFQQMPPNNFQQMPQSNFQQMPMSTFQQIPQSAFQQQHPQSGYQQMPLSSFQQQAPQSSYQKQTPQSNFQQPVPQSSFQQQMPQSNFQQFPQSNFQQMPPSNFQQMPQSGYQGPQSSFQQPPQSSFQQPPQSSYQQMPPTSFQQIPQSNFQHEQPTSQHPIRNQQQAVQTGPRVQGTSNNVANAPNDRSNDDNINARFSSVVTLSNDRNGQNAQPKDKVRSVVQLNNAETPTSVQGRQGPTPYGKVISGANREVESAEVERRSPPNSSGAASMAPMSSRLVQQAVQQPMPGGGSRISPPRIERQPSPPQHEPSPPFAGVKLRPVETRVSPPKVAPVPSPPSPPSAGPAPPPPPPPPVKAPPPPPPPPMSDEERRTSTGKKIFSAANVPQLDAREELMMAIRQFGGSGNLRKSPHPPPH